MGLPLAMRDPHDRLARVSPAHQTGRQGISLCRQRVGSRIPAARRGAGEVTPALVAGWVLAAVSMGAALWLWHALMLRGEVVRRACHELRGPLTAARLGLELEARLGRMAAASMPCHRSRAGAGRAGSG